MSPDFSKNNVIIADSQFLIAEALSSVLLRKNAFSVTTTVSDRYGLENLLGQGNNSLLITDPFTLGFDSVADFIEMIGRFHLVRVLILTNAIDKSQFLQFKKAGFKNIAYKTIASDELFFAIDACLQGKKYYAPELIEMMFDNDVTDNVLDDQKRLTAAEVEVVRLISQGMTTKEIALRKNVSFHTINTHRKNIFRKLGVSNVSEMVMGAIKLGLIDTIEYYI